MNDADKPQSHGLINGQIYGLVPAGGVGIRAQTPGVQSPKQYRLINGQPMLVWAVGALLAHEQVTSVVVGVQADDPFVADCFSGNDLIDRVRVLPSAGATRAQTVLQTLEQSGFAPHDWVLVHDAARPGLPLSNLTALIDVCLANQRGGLLAMPASDTVKLATEVPADADKLPSGLSALTQVDKTLPRESIWLAQTPQMFRAGELRQALSDALQAGVEVTDEASAMEWAGYKPLLVPGTARNLKVTWAEDFEWMQGIL